MTTGISKRLGKVIYYSFYGLTFIVIGFISFQLKPTFKPQNTKIFCTNGSHYVAEENEIFTYDFDSWSGEGSTDKAARVLCSYNAANVSFLNYPIPENRNYAISTTPKLNYFGGWFEILLFSLLITGTIFFGFHILYMYIVYNKKPLESLIILYRWHVKLLLIAVIIIVSISLLFILNERLKIFNFQKAEKVNLERINSQIASMTEKWKTQEDKEHGFRVSFPSYPNTTSGIMPIPGYLDTVFVVEKENKYIVDIMDYSVGTYSDDGQRIYSTDYVEKNLDEAFSRFATKEQVIFSNKRGLNRIDFVVSIQGTKARGVFWGVNDKALIVLVVGDDIFTPEDDYFINSFELL